MGYNFSLKRRVQNIEVLRIYKKGKEKNAMRRFNGKNMWRWSLEPLQ